MSVVTTTMYRVVCDEEGCDSSPQDHGDYFAWADVGAAYDEANGGDWAIRPGLDLCPEHGGRTVCMGDDEQCSRRDVSEADDGWMYCPDHREQGMDS